MGKNFSEFSVEFSTLVELLRWRAIHQEDAAKWDEEFLSDRLITEAHRPFNLEQGSLLRVSIFTRSPQDNILLLVVHHIVADLWSLTVLMDELGILYHAENNATPVTATFFLDKNGQP